MQQNTTFKDSLVIEHLNENYYCLSLNAEEKENVGFLGRTYKFSTNSYHELSEYLGKENDKLTFPTTVLFDSRLDVVKRVVGLAQPDSLTKK